MCVPDVIFVGRFGIAGGVPPMGNAGGGGDARWGDGEGGPPKLTGGFAYDETPTGGGGTPTGGAGGAGLDACFAGMAKNWVALGSALTLSNSDSRARGVIDNMPVSDGLR